MTGENENILRYVASPAHRAHTAHLVSGSQQHEEDVSALILSTNALSAYMGHKPHWWPSNGILGYERLPDSISGEPAIGYWRDVCASMCYRLHDDDVEMIQVDLRPGLYEGGNSGTDATSNPSTCTCYAYEDLANMTRLEYQAPSHAAPNDIAMATFLLTARLVNNYVGGNVTDMGMHYRNFINIYAAHREPWDSFFVISEQSSVFFKLALEPSYFIDMDVMAVSPGTYVDMTNVPDINACMRECASSSYAAKRMLMKTMVFEEKINIANRRCTCSTEDWLNATNDQYIVHDPLQRKRLVYRIKFCPGVSGGSERSVVYHRGVEDGAPSTCFGMPVGAGLILANGSIFLSRDASDDTRPIDLQCRAACDGNPDCVMAHSMVRHSL